MIRLSPIIRISLGLVLVTVSALFAGEPCGVVDDHKPAVWTAGAHA